jgi:uncharacterized membrane protein YpjA
MEHWSFSSMLLRVSAALLIALAVVDLAKIGLWLLVVSLLGDVAAMLPEPLRAAVRLIAAVSRLVIALAVIAALPAIFCGVFLLRFAERVDMESFSSGERSAWLAVLAVLAALSAVFNKWFYAAAYAMALIGVAIAHSRW